MSPPTSRKMDACASPRFPPPWQPLVSVGLCLHHRSRCACLACYDDVRCVSRVSTALPRSRHAQRVWGRCARIVHLRSAATVQPEFSNDVSLCADCRRGWHPFLERTSQLYKLALANWDSPDFAVSLPPTVAQFRLDLQLIASRLTLFAPKQWADRLVRGARFASRSQLQN